jgi:hypothetical protein
MTKTLLALLTSAFLATSAFGAEPSKKEEKPPVKKEKVCVDKMKDGKPVLGKDGKPEQNCKEVKIHEKLDGHKVPDKK